MKVIPLLIKFGVIAGAFASIQAFASPGCSAGDASGRFLVYRGAVTHVTGEPPKFPTIIREPGVDKALPIALDRLLPKGWTVYEERLSDRLPQTLSWPANGTWFNALGEALLLVGVRAEIDWHKNQVTLLPLREARPNSTDCPTRLVVPNTNAQRTQPPTASPMLVPTKSPRPSLAGTQSNLAQTWLVLPTDALRTVITRWSDASGWRLLYDASTDFQFRAGVELDGEFEAAICAVLGSVNSSVGSKGGARLTAAFWPGNKTVQIVDAVAAPSAPRTCESIDLQVIAAGAERTLPAETLTAKEPS